MLTNYFKIAFRYLWKQKGYAFINIMGLAVGLASCIIILLYINHEISYDKHHERADRIYRVQRNIDFSGTYMELAITPAPMGPTLKNEFPVVDATVRFRERGSFLVRHDDISLKEERIVFTDPTIFDVFTIPLLHGEAGKALTDPNTVVISKTTAYKYFGKTDVIGESLLLDNESTFTITGVMEDMPVTSHFHFDFLLSMSSIEEANEMVWFSNNFKTYVLLKEGADLNAFADYFKVIKNRYMEPQLKAMMGINFEEFEAAGNRMEFLLQPLTDIHLYSDLTGEFEANGSITYVYIFSGLALFILLLACINFMNLATARSSQRAKEVGVRKTLGSMKKQLAVQFLSESILLSSIAFVLSLLLVELTLPFFSEIAGRTIQSNYLAHPELMAYILLIVIGTGFLAGLYPAFMLSSFRPVTVLKGSYSEARGHSYLRKGLVIFQFCISMIIVVGLLVMNKQLSYVQNKELGYEKDQVIILNDTYALGDADRVKTFKEELLGYPLFENATISSYFPVEGYEHNDTVYWPEGTEPSETNTTSMQTWFVDDAYLPTLGMELLEGRNFVEDRSEDEAGVILNESAVKKLGYTEPVGKTVMHFNQDTDDGLPYLRSTVIGVIRNFHFQSLRENIQPLGLFLSNNRSNIAIKIATVDASQAIGTLRELWQQYAPDQPFNFTFMDQRYDQMYRAENRVQDLMAAFSVLAIIIACLGLFGLSAYSAERRNREIGIRKVMGANVQSILTLVSKEFIQLILISFLISLPVAWVVMNEWLEGFTYHTSLDIWVFGIAIVGMLMITLLTVSWQSIKAAIANPVDSLRSE